MASADQKTAELANAFARLVGLDGLASAPAPAKPEAKSEADKSKKTPEAKAAKAEKKLAKEMRKAEKRRDRETEKLHSEVKAVDFQLRDYIARSSKARR